MGNNNSSAKEQTSEQDGSTALGRPPGGNFLPLNTVFKDEKRAADGKQRSSAHTETDHLGITNMEKLRQKSKAFLLDDCAGELSESIELQECVIQRLLDENIALKKEVDELRIENARLRALNPEIDLEAGIRRLSTGQIPKKRKLSSGRCETVTTTNVCYMKKPSEKEVLNLDATVLQRLHDVCLKRRIELCKIPWQVGRSDPLTFVFVHYATDLERAIDIALADVKDHPVCLVVLQGIQKYQLKKTRLPPTTDLLPKTTTQQTSCVAHLVYSRNEGIYECDENDKAFRVLREFLERYGEDGQQQHLSQ